MAGYSIHLAVAKVYEEFYKIEDIESFERGVIAPDLEKDKSISHFGPKSDSPDLNRYLREKGVKTDFDEGYLLHLITDYLFYKVLLEGKCDERIYGDYDILNGRIIAKYNIVIPEELKETVKIKDKYEDKELAFLSPDVIYNFIDTVGRIDIRRILRELSKDNNTDFQSIISKIQFQSKEKKGDAR